MPEEEHDPRYFCCQVTLLCKGSKDLSTLKSRRLRKLYKM
jgi:hypothetical protein